MERGPPQGINTGMGGGMERGPGHGINAGMRGEMERGLPQDIDTGMGGGPVINSNNPSKLNNFSQPKPQVKWGFIGDDGKPVFYNEVQNNLIELVFRKNQNSVEIESNGQNKKSI
jgi:hypothetical protein